MRTVNGEVVRTDPTGKEYEREDFESLLPLDNYMQLYKDQRMPKEIDGVAITPEKLRRERLNLRMKPELFDSPGVPLYPLLESESGRARLEAPADMMRLGSTIEFIDVKQNRVIEEKSARFQKAFTNFKFPAKLVAGNPSTLKPYDEGYYLVDSAGSIFHFRQVRGTPELTRISDVVPNQEQQRWLALKPKFIHVQEQDNHEIRAVIIDQNGKANLVLNTNYQLVPLPLEHYDPISTVLTLRGDLLNRLISANTRNSTEVIVLNRNYEFVDRYFEQTPSFQDQTIGKISRVLFPFTLDFDSNNSGYLTFHIAPGSLFAIVLNAGLVIFLIAWTQLRKQALSWLDTAWVAIGGIYGLILVFTIPGNK